MKISQEIYIRTRKISLNFGSHQDLESFWRIFQHCKMEQTLHSHSADGAAVWQLYCGLQAASVRPMHNSRDCDNSTVWHWRRFAQLTDSDRRPTCQRRV